jgi:hypothetical protein
VEGSPKAGKAGKGKKGKKEEEAEVVVGETEPDIEELISRMSQGGEGEDWDFKSHTKFLMQFSEDLEIISPNQKAFNGELATMVEETIESFERAILAINC